MTSLNTPLWVLCSCLPITVKYCVRAVVGVVFDGLSPMKPGFDPRLMHVGFVEDQALRLSFHNHTTTSPYSFIHPSSTLCRIFAIGSAVQRHNNNKKIVLRNSVLCYYWSHCCQYRWHIELQLKISVQEPRYLRQYRLVS